MGGLLQLIAYGLRNNLYYIKHNINNIITNFQIYNLFENKVFNMFNYNYESICCEKMNIDKLPKFKLFESFVKLKNFNCSHNNIKNLKKLIYSNQLVWLNCSYNKLITIPNKMFVLEYFDFSNNNVMGNIDFTLYPNLKYVMASSNQITTVNNLSDKLEYLDLSNNPISELNKLPNGLKYLLLVQTRIKSINLLELENLKYLDISINSLQQNTFDRLPNSLIHLECSKCNIEYLVNIPIGINKFVNLILLNH